MFEQCEKSGVKVVDATCPYVKVIRNKAAEYFGKGYLIVLVGDKNHPELQGINGWCGDSAVFFDGKGKLRLGNGQKCSRAFSDYIRKQKS